MFTKLKGYSIVVIVMCLIWQSVHADELNQIFTRIAGSVGTGQNVAVVLCRYQGINTPIVDSATPPNNIDSSEAIANLMTTAVNAHYLQATKIPLASSNSSQAHVSFNFIPVPGICNFSYSPPLTSDDPIVMIRELIDGIKYADEATPNIFNTTNRVLVVVNANIRNRATMTAWPTILPNSGFKLLSGAIIDIRTMTESDLSTVSHELGHQLGLPDLYSESRPPSHIGEWGVMGIDKNQNFSAYSRFSAHWITNPSERVLTISPPVELIDVEIDLGLPNNEANLTEVIRLDVSDSTSVIGGTLPLNGYLIEARNPAMDPADASLNSTTYQPGVLIFRLRGWANAYIQDRNTGNSDPAPRPITLCGTTAASCGTITAPASASLTAGSSFTDVPAGIRVDVLAQNPGGEHRLRLRWDPPPRPNIAITDMRLDSPTNGMGTFQLPLAYGDPISYTVALNWTDTFIPMPLQPTIVPMVHSINITLANLGAATPAGAFVNGILYLLRPSIPAGPIETVDDIKNMAFQEIPFQVISGSLPAADPAVTSIELSMPISPAGPFIAWAVIENKNEINDTLADNAYMESFIVFQLSSGSPFEPLDLTLPVTNINEKENVFAISTTAPSPLSEQWSFERLENQNMKLGAGQSKSFHIKVKPPQPEDMPKPFWPGQFDVITWMSDRDSFIPVNKLPIYYNLNQGTQIKLNKLSSGKPAIRGRLVKIKNNKELGGIANQNVEVVISVSNGSQQSYFVTTNAEGEFTQEFNEVPDSCHAVVARYSSTLEYGEAESEVQQYFNSGCRQSNAPVVELSKLELKAIQNRLGDDAFWLILGLSGKAPAEGVKVKLSGNATRYFNIPKTVLIPQGKNTIKQKVKIRRTTSPSPKPYEKAVLIARYANKEKTLILRNRKILMLKNSQRQSDLLKRTTPPIRPN